MSLRPPKSRVVSWLRGVVLAGATGVLCWPLTIGSGTATAMLSALLAVLAADKSSRSRLRLPTTLLLSFLAMAAGQLLVHLWTSSSTLAAALGPVPVLRVGEAMRWLALVFPAVFALRFLASRRPLFAVVEVLAVALAFSSGFAAHRDGMVHRPLSIGDWAWSRGLDPALIFLALGGLGTLLLAALLVSESRRRRLPLHFSALVLVALFLFFFVRVEGLPKPQPSSDLGLTGDSEAEDSEGENEQQRSGGDGQGEDDQLEDLDFKDEYSSSGGEAPVAVVVLHDDYSPPSGVYYFRQTAFSQYNGRRLVQPTRDDVDLDVVRRFPPKSRVIEAAPPVSDQRRRLETSMGLLVDHVRPFALDSPAVLGPIANPNPLRFQRAFQVVSHVQTLPYDQMIGKRPGHADWDDEIWEHYTEQPSDPRYAETAEGLMDWLLPEYRDDPLAQALAIKSYLDQNGIYSRRSRHADQDDPAGSFLFGDLTGYCVHFAHAATYLFRSRGLPARVAAGYAVAESSRGGSSAIVIRGADAHAWPEIYLEGVGWVVVDLTPEQSLDEPPEDADPELQRMLGEMMRQQMWQQDDLAAQTPFDFSRLFRLLLLGLLAVVALAYLVKLYRFAAPRLTSEKHLYRVGYRSALDRLADLGVRRRRGESRERFAARVAGLAPSFVALTEQHLGAALGSRRQSDPRRLRLLGDQVFLELWQNAPPWKRWLGAIHPFSWILIR